MVNISCTSPRSSPSKAHGALALFTLLPQAVKLKLLTAAPGVLLRPELALEGGAGGVADSGVTLSCVDRVTLRLEVPRPLTASGGKAVSATAAAGDVVSDAAAAAAAGPPAAPAAAV